MFKRGLLLSLCTLPLLFACVNGELFTTRDDNFYWKREYVTSADESASNHVLFLVDDSGSMFQRIQGLKQGLPGLVSDLSLGKVNYHLHMLLFSQVDFDKMARGVAALDASKTAQTFYGKNQIDGVISNLAVNTSFAEEYGISALSAWMRKLFPQWEDGLNIENLRTMMTPVRHAFTPTMDQRNALNPFFSNVFAVNNNPYIPIFDNIFIPNDLNKTIANIQIILDNYNYYLYPYLRDQVINQRGLNNVYPVVLTDEDDAGVEMLLTGTPDSFEYEYERTFIQTSAVVTQRVCVANNAIDPNIGYTSWYQANYGSGPTPGTGYRCTDQGGRMSFGLSWNVAGWSGWGVCRHPMGYRCKKIGSDGQPLAAEQIFEPATQSTPWDMWAYVENTFGPPAPPYTCPHTNLLTKTNWDTPTPNAPFWTYNQVCYPTTSNTRLSFLPNTCLHPLHQFPGMEDCRMIETCTPQVRPAVQGQVVGQNLSITNANICTASETLQTAPVSGFVQAVTPDNKPLRWFGTKTLNSALPPDTRVTYWKAKVRGKFVSNTYLDTDQAIAAIQADLASKAVNPLVDHANYPGLYPNEVIVEANIESPYMEQVLTIHKMPVAPEGDGRALYSNAAGFHEWARNAFPDLAVQVNAVVRFNKDKCNESDVLTAGAGEGKAYRQLAELSGGIEMNLCALGPNADFTDFLTLLAERVITNNRQGIPLEGPRNQGVFEVLDISANKKLLEGVHWDFQPNQGKHGYVILRKAAVPAGHKIQVSVLRK